MGQDPARPTPLLDALRAVSFVVAMGVFLVVLGALVLALVARKWAAVSVLLLLAGITCPNFAKAARRRRAEAERQAEGG